MISGNKGEWSEIYAFFKLLADGKVYAADEKLNKIHDTYFPIIRIIREEIKGQKTFYETGEVINVYVDDEEEPVYSNHKSKFIQEADAILNSINSNQVSSKLSFEETEQFMNEISCYKISAPSIAKADITMKIKDIQTGYSPEVGFSIKSELGRSPTLLNAGKTTNFKYNLTEFDESKMENVNSIDKLGNRLTEIIKEESTLEYYGMNNKTFEDNLVLIDSKMDEMIGQTLLYYYRDGMTNCLEMVDRLQQENPLKYGNVHAYSYKFKKFLTAVALGMRPGTMWDGIDEANGGYIIVKKDGEVLAYHIYNRNYFEDYLLKNTKYETASTSRHDFGRVYNEKNDYFLNLNLQVRFK